MPVGEVIQMIVPGLVFPIWALSAARIGDTYRPLRLPSVWIPIAVALTGGIGSIVALLTRPDASVGVVLWSVMFIGGWGVAYVRLASLRARFTVLMTRLTRYLDDRVRPEHPALVEKDFLELRRLVVKLQPAVPDGETMLQQIDEVLRTLGR